MLDNPASVQFKASGRDEAKTIFNLLREAEAIALALADNEQEDYGAGEDVREFGNQMMNEIGRLIFWGVELGITEPNR